MPESTTPPPNSLIDDVSERRLRLGVLISGSGTNLQAIIDGCAEGTLDAEVAVVVSDKAAAFGLERARKANIPAVFLVRADFEDITGFNREIARVLLEHQVGLVVMAGYMRLLGRRVLESFPGRVMITGSCAMIGPLSKLSSAKWTVTPVTFTP
jgi:formyltetrahydrofolate hydrolase